MNVIEVIGGTIAAMTMVNWLVIGAIVGWLPLLMYIGDPQQWFLKLRK